jgi:hypothetical protein
MVAVFCPYKGDGDQDCCRNAANVFWYIHHKIRMDLNGWVYSERLNAYRISRLFMYLNKKPDATKHATTNIAAPPRVVFSKAPCSEIDNIATTKKPKKADVNAAAFFLFMISSFLQLD